MVLVDTSVWIDYFRSGVPALADALRCDRVLLHPVVIGELATGNLKHRAATLADLRRQPLAAEGTFEECLHFIEMHHLHGRGIGWNDVQLLVSARLSSVQLWSTDRRLAETAKYLGLDFTP